MRRNITYTILGFTAVDISTMSIISLNDGPKAAARLVSNAYDDKRVTLDTMGV